MLILSFYFMVDGARLADSLIAALPLRAQDDSRFLVASIHRAFAGFLRGQMIQSLVGGLGTGVIMSAAARRLRAAVERGCRAWCC